MLCSQSVTAAELANFFLGLPIRLGDQVGWRHVPANHGISIGQRGFRSTTDM
jgi:hypothetical protein